MDAITYFGEEKIQNLFCLILGSLSVILSLLFFGIIKYSFYKGMAIPLLLFGTLQLVTGAIVVNRTAAGTTRVEHMMRQDPEKFKTEELVRMQKVQKNFITCQWIETGLILAGLFLYIKFFRSPLIFWKGMGLGLVLQAAAILSLDTMAENRAEQYIQYLIG